MKLKDILYESTILNIDLRSQTKKQLVALLRSKKKIEVSADRFLDDITKLIVTADNRVIYSAITGHEHMIDGVIYQPVNHAAASELSMSYNRDELSDATKKRMDELESTSYDYDFGEAYYMVQPSEKQEKEIEAALEKFLKLHDYLDKETEYQETSDTISGNKINYDDLHPKKQTVTIAYSWDFKAGI